VFLLHLGFAYQQLARYAEAADAFGKAKAVGGDADATLLGHQVEALTLAKDYERGLTAVRDARKRFPDDADLATQEATLLRLKGDMPGATAIVEGLRKKTPPDAGVLVEVADFYQRAKRYQDAEATLRDARKLSPRDVRILFQLGAALERQKRADDAEAVFREALAVQPDSAPILNYLGYMNADRGVKVDEAMKLIQRAVDLDPENGAYLDSLGWAHYRLEQLVPAEEYLRRAVSKERNSAVVYDHLGDILKRRGNVQEALVYWQRALDGEDEGEELDRAGVQRKIREGQASLNDGGQRRQ